jgi:FkbM family methyltransferase
LAFEPAPANVRRLINETSGFANVKILPCAVSDSPGHMELTLSPDSAIDHHLSGRKIEGAQTVMVKAVALDEACADLPSVDIIKMDIQGAEHLAILGMTGLLARSPACVIVMEVWPWGLRRAGGDWRELMELLKESGFTARSFDGRDVEEWCRINADRSDAHLDVIWRRRDQPAFDSLPLRI